MKFNKIAKYSSVTRERKRGKRREREESVAAANGGVDFSISE